MIPSNHICFFIEQFVESLDFSGFDLINEGPGHPAYHPRIVMKVLLQGMLSGERSSRKLSRACRENFVFMYLAEKVNPDFRTFCRFRRQNASFIKETFKETVNLASKNDLIDLSLICTDGTMMSANANKKKSLKREHFEKLDEVIEKMIADDIEQDEIDEKFEKEENLTNMDKRDFKRLVSEYRRVKDKKKLKKKFENVKKELKKNPEVKKVSLTDPESRMMQNKKRITESSYNVQFSVSKNQIILANDVCQDGHDVDQLIPQVEMVKENVELPNGVKFSADCGYSSGDNYKFLEDEKLDGFIPSRSQAQKLDGKEESLNHDNYEFDEKKNELIVEGVRFQFRGSYVRKNGRKILTFYNKKLKKKKDIPFYFRARLRMKVKMETDEGRMVYGVRNETVEPVIGNVKENLGLRGFRLRGLEGGRIELDLVSAAHNLGKIWRMGGRVRVVGKKIVLGGGVGRKEKEFGLDGDVGGKNIVFWFVVFSWNLIVRRPPLLNAPTTKGRRVQRGSERSGESSEVGVSRAKPN